MSDDFQPTILQVMERLNTLPPALLTEDARGIMSRIMPIANAHGMPSHDRAVTLAALAVALVAAIEYAENLDITSGAPT